MGEVTILKYLKWGFKDRYNLEKNNIIIGLVGVLSVSLTAPVANVVATFFLAVVLWAMVRSLGA